MQYSPQPGLAPLDLRIQSCFQTSEIYIRTVRRYTNTTIFTHLLKSSLNTHHPSPLSDPPHGPPQTPPDLPPTRLLSHLSQATFKSWHPPLKTNKTKNPAIMTRKIHPYCSPRSHPRSPQDVPYRSLEPPRCTSKQVVPLSKSKLRSHFRIRPPETLAQPLLHLALILTLWLSDLQ